MKKLRLTMLSVVCAALGFALVAFWPAAAPSREPRRLIDQPASSIVSVLLADGFAERLGPERWVVDRTVASIGIKQASGVRWSGDPVRLRALTRLLSGAMALSGGDPAADGPSGIVRCSDGSSYRFEFSALAVGGKVGVRVTPSNQSAPSQDSKQSWAGLVDAELMDLFAGGVEPWLSRAAMPDVPMDPASITIDTQQETLELDRLGSRWAMRTPVAAPCDADLVKLAARQFAALSGDRLLDDSELLTTSAIATWSVRDARRGGRTWRVETLLPIGEHEVAVRCTVLDAQGKTLMGPVVMAIDRSETDRIDATASAYLNRHALALSPADLRTLTIAAQDHTSVFSRDASLGNGWFDPQGTADPGAEDLAKLLTEHTALIAVPSEQLAEGYLPKFTIGFSTRPPSTSEDNPGGSAPLETLSIGLYESSGRSRLAIEYRGVLRVYDDREAQAAWAWLGSLIP